MAFGNGLFSVASQKPVAAMRGTRHEAFAALRCLVHIPNVLVALTDEYYTTK